MQEQHNQQDSTTLTTAQEVSSTIPGLVVGKVVPRESASPRADANGTAQADLSDTVIRDDMASKKQKTMKGQHVSPMHVNGDAVVEACKKSRQQMRENMNPATMEAPVKPTPNQQETQEQRLERLQKQAMTKLGNKIRHQSNEPTTSSHVLHLARQTSTSIKAEEPGPEPPKTTTVVLSSETIAQMNGAKDQAKCQEGAATQSNLDGSLKAQVCRQKPNDRSARSSTASTRGRRGGRASNFKRNNRWATAAETKPPPAPPKSIDSNAFASEVPSDAETASGDSVAAMDNGKLLRNKRPAGPDAPLADWSGNLMPPHIPWDQRPRCSNPTAEYLGGFSQWNATTAAHSRNADTGLPFARLSRDLVLNANLHPDGLNLVDPTMSVDVDTAQNYGYFGDALVTIRRDARLIDADIFTEDWGKLDLRDPENMEFKDETCEHLLKNYNENKAKEREGEITMKKAQRLARRREDPIIPTPNPHVPRINIYLRPAVRSDVPQLLEIYNSYVTNTVRTTEIHPITYDDMLARLTDSTDEKLPFLVAVSKSLKVNREVGNTVEKIVGWASATDWVNRSAAERFSVDLEIYVHQRHLHQGVGKCLMDKLIDSTDRGHITRKGYPFTCTPELRHAYSAGGARDLIKLIIVVRSFDKPRNKKENDLPWIKKWLEDGWNFEQQGHIPKVGVKFKR